jgi:hypothetical protein
MRQERPEWDSSSITPEPHLFNKRIGMLVFHTWVCIQNQKICGLWKLAAQNHFKQGM